MIENSNNKVRDHCHIRGAAYWNCNIDLKFTKKVPVIFDSLKGYGSDLIFKELGRFNVKIHGIPNGLEKYTDFTFNKNIFLLTIWNL